MTVVPRLSVYEPLAQTAPLTRRLAESHCAGCAWYHGFWPTLRRLGMAASPDRHQDFFLDALGGLARAGHRRVLVSGAADSSMLAHVLEAWRAVGRPDVTVLDRCPTPGVLSTWYAQLCGVEIATAVADVVDYAPDEPFSVVCTHSFLSQFAPPDRPLLIAAWHRLLGPGGAVVTTARLSPPGTDEPIRFTPAQVDAFAARAGAEAERLVDEDPAEVAAAARRYAERLVVHATFTVAEVAGLFEDGGFTVERLDQHHVGGALGPGSGPATNQPASHLQIVARRD
ncbi:MAG: hypothetical protein QOH36_1761 [Actinomycetota bacterium]|nr:hypothetical protein [Actinomycetota bacterium]